MTELALTILRLGFLLLLWMFVLIAVVVLRRDLRAPRDARPLVPMSGRKQRGAGAPDAVPVPAPRAKAVKVRRGGPSQLVVTEGALIGTVIPLGAAPVTLGRAPDSTVVLDDDYASNSHARLTQSDGHWIVQDLGSTNGTWIGHTRITAPTAFTIGQQLRVGRTTLELRK